MITLSLHNVKKQKLTHKEADGVESTGHQSNTIGGVVQDIPEDDSKTGGRG